jgi:hypothetical protein
MYIHPLSAWVLVAHAVATVWFGPAEWRRRLLALYIPVAVAAIPIIRFLIINRSKAYWVPPVTPYLFVHNLSQLMGAAMLAVALTLVVVLGIGRAWRRELAVPGLWLPLLVGGLTVSGVLLMSFVIQPLFVDRYLIGVLPVLLIVVARAVRALPFPRLFLAGLLALSLASTTSWYLTGLKDDWRGAVAYVESQAQPTDGVIFWPNYYRMPFTYYGIVGQPIFPPVPWSTHYLPNLGISNVMPVTVPNDRIWLVRNETLGPSPELTALIDQYTTVESHQFGAAMPVIELLVRR